MKRKYIQRNKVTLSLGPNQLVWMLWFKYEWMSNLKSVPSNSFKINISYCLRNLKFKTKIVLFMYFGEQIEKDIDILAISTLKMESFM